MSILKVILHHWNKTTQSYDNFHPETEVSQVTDWNQGIVNTLASTALGGLVNTLTSDSLLAKMIQKVFEATGVKYSLGQNGYVCFGSLVGGLIIQWVYYSDVKQTGEEQTIYFPIAFPNAAVTVADSVDTPNAFYRTSKLTTNSLVFSVTNTGYVSSTCRAVIIGY
nr:MAG TPA: putative tail fiber protein [Caudoviricetes sp.]